MIQLIVGAAIGAAAMYLLDPQQGRARQAQARDKLKQVSNETQETAERAAKKAGDQAQNVKHQAQNVKDQAQSMKAEAEEKAASTEGPVSNVELAERVRAEVNRSTSHSGAIVVAVEDGQVTLSGRILRSEESDVVKAVKGTRGVKGVTNRLEVHDQPGNIPDLQG